MSVRQSFVLSVHFREGITRRIKAIPNAFANMISFEQRDGSMASLTKQLQVNVSNESIGTKAFVTNLELTTASGFGLLFLDSSTGIGSERALVFFDLVFVVLVFIVLVVSVVVVLLDDRLDLGFGTLDQDRMTANVLALHLFCSLEKFVSISQADKTEALAFGGSLVANDTSLLD